MSVSPQLGFHFPADICANRHKGARCSVEANVRVEPSKANVRERVRLFVGGCGPQGCTLKDICSAFCKLPNELSGRVSELKADGVIFDSGRTKDGCSVLVADKSWVNGGAK